MVLRHYLWDDSREAKANDRESPGRGRDLPMHGAPVWPNFANAKGNKAHFTGHHDILIRTDWITPRLELLQRFEVVGQGKIDEDADIVERREGRMEASVTTGHAETRENAEGETP
jgi:hypothetical protein